MSEPLPRLWTPEAKPFRFCPKCGTELVTGKRELTGYDPFRGTPMWHTPLVCPGRGRWWKRCDW